jgi:hypothetical protein
VTGETDYKLNGENFHCFIVEASCNSPFGNSRLTTFFNDNYGFMKMDYTNMDGSHFTFSLEMVQDLEEIKKLQTLFKY